MAGASLPLGSRKPPRPSAKPLAKLPKGAAYRAEAFRPRAAKEEKRAADSGGGYSGEGAPADGSSPLSCRREGAPPSGGAGSQRSVRRQKATEAKGGGKKVGGGKPKLVAPNGRVLPQKGYFFTTLWLRVTLAFSVLTTYVPAGKALMSTLVEASCTKRSSTPSRLKIQALSALSK